MITSHTYDAGWPRDDSAGCIADLDEGGDACGRPLHQHAASEYSSDTLERRLADATPVTLAEVIRMLELPAGAGSRLAWAAQMTPSDSEHALPAPLPGAKRLPIAGLVRAANGGNPEGQPLWKAGDILIWGMRTARLDRALLPIPQRTVPPRLRRA